jgi:hypothetical protein
MQESLPFQSTLGFAVKFTWNSRRVPVLNDNEHGHHPEGGSYGYEAGTREEKTSRSRMSTSADLHDATVGGDT